eukprot:CAMPEP_0178748786 /NCGR_PEP_ID=MMETSP0744-20121128/9063_1 /TAXON_ID=913974 /ORGANISM="Nitzschia punctata, Strain CCMP561" /LENGTH=271 /DNA_ID=CAMNT_0020402157 /DNA_START=102 /DNA_END=917 /DNA_ORIENTATION=-
MNANERVTDMILRAPRLNQKNIEEALSDRDIIALEEFENKWHSFLSSNPGILPPGKKLKSCLEIQNQLDEIEVAKQNAQMELQRQLDFFNNSKDQLEANFTKAMEEAALMQQDIIRSLNKEIDDIALADQTLSATLPWRHFFNNLQAITDENNVPEGMSTGESACSRGIKPSSQAMYLANNTDQAVVAQAALEGKSSNVLLRAFHIDNGLLKAEIKMAQREIDRLERTTKSQRVLSKFLTEHNIWGLLTKGDGGTVGGGNSTLPRSIRPYS